MVTNDMLEEREENKRNVNCENSIEGNVQYNIKGDVNCASLSSL